jgi:hypothetical protein
MSDWLNTRGSGEISVKGGYEQGEKQNLGEGLYDRT